MKHLSALVFSLLLIAAGFYVLWTLKAHPSTVTMFAGLGSVVLGVGIAVPADLGKALSAASPLLSRVPMPAVARATIAQRISTSVQAIPEDAKP